MDLCCTNKQEGVISEEKIYIDAEQIGLKNGTFGVIISDENGKPKEIVYTGKILTSMPISEKTKERAYKILAEDYDICFIFDDNIPNIDFYPVPKLEIFAFDSYNGFFCSANDSSEKNAQIYYIDESLNIYCLASNIHEFIRLCIYNPEWKNKLFKHDLIKERADENKQYLVDKLKLSDINYKEEIEIEKSIKIYNSFEEAKKEISFYDLSEIKNKLEFQD